MNQSEISLRYVSSDVWLADHQVNGQFVLPGAIEVEMMLAMLSISTMWPQQTLKGIQIDRIPITPVTAGRSLLIDLTIANTTGATKRLLQIRDQTPRTLTEPQIKAVPTLPLQDSRTK